MDEPSKKVEIDVPRLGPAEYLDLEQLVRRFRRLTWEKAMIPSHNGRSSSIRQSNRARRKALSNEIDELKRQIIAWAGSFVPPSPEDRPASELDQDYIEELMWQCEGCGALWPLSIDSCDGSWIHDNDDDEEQGPVHDLMHRPERTN